MSVVGFDDAPQSPFHTPALTTVRLDFVALGHACFGLLHAALRGEEPPRPHPVGRPELIVRESAGPFRRG